MFLAWTCACVSVVMTPPSPSFLSLSPSHISLSSPPPSFCVFPALLSLLAVSGEQQRLHYRQGERVLPLLTHKHTIFIHYVTTVHCGNRTRSLPQSFCSQLVPFGGHHTVLFRLMQLKEKCSGESFGSNSVIQYLTF